MNRCDSLNELDEERVWGFLPQAAPRDRLLVVLGMETGLRLSERLSLEVSSVWRNGAPVSVLRVPRRQLKDGRGPRARSVPGRAIPLNLRAQAAIADCIASRQIEPSNALFPSREGGRALTRRQGTRIVRRVLVGAGLDPNRVWGGHSLRRRFCQRIYDATKDIDLTRAAVGHRWIQTTQLYLGLVDESAAEAIFALGRRGRRRITRSGIRQALGHELDDPVCDQFRVFVRECSSHGQGSCRPSREAAILSGGKWSRPNSISGWLCWSKTSPGRAGGRIRTCS
jgi:site-specific recombinase XerC